MTGYSEAVRLSRGKGIWAGRALLSACLPPELLQASGTGGDPVVRNLRLPAAAQRLGATVELIGSVLHLTATDRDAFEIARDALTEVGAPLRRLAAKRTTLEDVFMGEGSNG